MTGFLGSAFQLAFSVSPIILTNGIASDIPGSALPIVSLTEPLNFAAGILSGGSPLNLDSFFAQFKPLAGATLIDNDVGTYPFANQNVAANTIIAKPLRISMLMICPAKGFGGYGVKLATMIALKNTLDQHNNSGGTYTIVTPSYLYEACLLTGMRDVSSGESKQAEVTWQLDFVKPLITLAQAQQAQNAQMSRISSGVPVTPDAQGQIQWSGPDIGVGNPSSLMSPDVIPAAQPLTGTSVGNNTMVG